SNSRRTLRAGGANATLRTGCTGDPLRTCRSGRPCRTRGTRGANQPLRTLRASLAGRAFKGVQRIGPKAIDVDPNFSAILIQVEVAIQSCNDRNAATGKPACTTAALRPGWAGRTYGPLRPGDTLWTW